MTSNDDAEVVTLVTRTGRSRACTNLGQVVGNIDLEAMQVVQEQTVLQARTAEVSVKQTAVLVLQDFHKHGVHDQPTTGAVNKLSVEQTSHTSNDGQWRNRARSSSGSTGEAGGDRNRVSSISTRRGDVAKAVLGKLHAGEQFVSTGSRNSLGARSSRTSGRSISILSSLLEAAEIAKNVSIVLVTQTIGSTIRSQGHEVHMAVSSFDVIHFECEVVRLVNDQREILVIQILSSDLRTTSVGLNSQLGFFDDLNGISEVGDFAKVVGVSDGFNSRSLAECKLYLLGIDNWGKVTIRQVAVTGSGGKCHDVCPPKTM